MVTKRVSPGAKTTAKRKKATAARKATDNAVVIVLESEPFLATVSMSIDPDVRRQLVAAEAYFLAERRGFAAGRELEDWIAAEVAVDSRLQQRQDA